MRNWAHSCRKCFGDASFISAFMVAVLFFIASLAINYYSTAYATKQASNPVTDIVLDNIPVFDVDELFVYGTLVVVLFSFAVSFAKPERLPFAFKSLALFIVIRSFFVILTHIGPFPTETSKTSYDFLNSLLFGADRFFSGHTGMPFLGALIFWEHKVIRAIYILASIFFGVVVLMGHLHYTIDVLSAFFITYTIFHIAEYLFKRDRALFLYGQSIT